MKARRHWRYWTGRLWAFWGAKKQRELFRTINTYCMFIGHGRSGHSFYGSLLNAHPEAVVAHECDALLYVKNGISRDHLFALILREDRLFSKAGRKSHGFHHVVPNQWQGKFQRLKVIGDKKGGVSTSRLTKSPELLEKLRDLVQMPVKMIHIVRNPFDNISSIARYNGKPLEQNIAAYFAMADTNARLIRENGADVLTLRHEDFIARPPEHVKQMVEFVGLSADQNYLADCAGVAFDSPNKSREQAPWTSGLIQSVHSQIEAYPFLRGYTFEN
jgi:hypothetical protein